MTYAEQLIQASARQSRLVRVEYEPELAAELAMRCDSQDDDEAAISYRGEWQDAPWCVQLLRDGSGDDE